MAALPNPNSAFGRPTRRSFFSSLLAFGLAAKATPSERVPETAYRFFTPECEVRMSVEYYARSTGPFRFRENLTNRAFCLDGNGAQTQRCQQEFSGSMAIARYRFRSLVHSPTPRNLRERVLTIDHDSRIVPRPPFERTLTVEREVVSDVQAFGYDPNNPQDAQSRAKALTVWCLLRQDLYLNDPSAAFLVVHWKHTVDFISLLDVIPGDEPH
jgi:hypothetical protein